MGNKTNNLSFGLSVSFLLAVAIAAIVYVIRISPQDNPQERYETRQARERRNVAVYLRDKTAEYFKDEFLDLKERRHILETLDNLAFSMEEGELRSRVYRDSEDISFIILANGSLDGVERRLNSVLETQMASLSWAEEDTTFYLYRDIPRISP